MENLDRFFEYVKINNTTSMPNFYCKSNNISKLDKKLNTHNTFSPSSNIVIIDIP